MGKIMSQCILSCRYRRGNWYDAALVEFCVAKTAWDFAMPTHIDRDSSMFSFTLLRESISHDVSFGCAKYILWGDFGVVLTSRREAKEI